MVAARRIVESVTDPEIPVLSIADLGILRDVGVTEAGEVVVTITPTYSGCPAMDQIEEDILDALASEGYRGRVETTFVPAWTTEWMSDAARRKLVGPPPVEPDQRFGVSTSMRCLQIRLGVTPRQSASRSCARRSRRESNGSGRPSPG